jgi:hypothetical protein
VFVITDQPDFGRNGWSAGWHGNSRLATVNAELPTSPFKGIPGGRAKRATMALALAWAFMTAGRLQAGSVLYGATWMSDSYCGFDVIFSGTGPGWSGSLVSPSGLWQLDSDNVVEYPVGLKGQQGIFIANWGVATYLGSLPANFPAPDSSPNAPFNAASLFTCGNYQDFSGTPLSAGYLGEQGWSGTACITITSMPDMADVSTWSWRAEYEASGPTLAPEPKTISILYLAAAGGFFRTLFKRRKPAGQDFHG